MIGETLKDFYIKNTFSRTFATPSILEKMESA